MKKFFKSKFFYIITVLTLAAVIFPTVLSIMGQGSVFRSVASTIALPFQKAANAIGDAFSGFFSYFSEYDDLLEENEKLREEINSLRDEKYKSEAVREENEWLSGFLNIKMQNPGFNMTEATIVGRESNNYSTVFILDRGKSSGIAKNMPVITSDGVLGYTAEVGPNWAKVYTFTESSSAVGVFAERTKVTGVVEGDYNLSLEGICKMLYIDEKSDIAVGDRILTSGFGGVYPRGLVVGYVKSVEKNAESRSLVAYITPAANETKERDLSRVMVITGYEEAE